MSVMIDRSVMQKSIQYPTGPAVYLVGALIAGIILKLVLLAFQAVPFNADEAVVALMGRHILQGQQPLFFYGQAYMGSLDAFFVAAIFRIIGFQVWGIRFVQMVLYSCTLFTTYWLGRQITGRWQVGVIATWLLALPTITPSTPYLSNIRAAFSAPSMSPCAPSLRNCCRTPSRKCARSCAGTGA